MAVLINGLEVIDTPEISRDFVEHAPVKILCASLILSHDFFHSLSFRKSAFKVFGRRPSVDARQA